MQGKLRKAVAGLVVASIACAGGLAYMHANAAESNVGELGFANELRIPPLAEGVLDADGTRVFELDLQEGSTEFRDGVETPTWGVNGSYLGPTLRVRRGERVRIEVRNGLPEATTLHWHGMHLPAAADGGPHQTIEPGAVWSPGWKVGQPAATLWYHPHMMGSTAAHVYRGVAGMFIVDDDEADAAGLPGRYGVDDVPLIVQDRRFNGDGSFDESAGMISPTGILGDEILVNGTRDPHFDVTTRLVRLRLLNAANARIFNLGLADRRPLWLVGTDGGLLPEPVERETLQLSPGERAEVLVRMAPGERVVLRSFEPDLGADFFNEPFVGGKDEFDVLELRAADELSGPSEPPSRLVEMPEPDPGEAVGAREFVLNGTTINAQAMDMGRIDAVVERDASEVWVVRNDASIPHSFHVHDVRFHVLAVDGEGPPPELSGLKDTVNVRPKTEMRLLVRFEDYADPGLPCMFHCHVLQHEDRGMMGQFVVVDGSDERPGRIEAEHADHAGR